MSPHVHVPAFKAIWSRFRLPAFTSIGCYTIGYYDLKAGDMLCADCASLERFKVDIVPDVYWEGPIEYCTMCNAGIESSYGDPDDQD